jgi:hypothetical protein
LDFNIVNNEFNSYKLNININIIQKTEPRIFLSVKLR